MCRDNSESSFMGVVVSLNASKDTPPSVEDLIRLTKPGMDQVNDLILQMAGANVDMISMEVFYCL